MRPGCVAVVVQRTELQQRVMRLALSSDCVLYGQRGDSLGWEVHAALLAGCYIYRVDSVHREDCSHSIVCVCVIVHMFSVNSIGLLSGVVCCLVCFAAKACLCMLTEFLGFSFDNSTSCKPRPCGTVVLNPRHHDP